MNVGRSLHVQRVLSLYKTILRLHQHLPTDLKSVGDRYVRNEFRLHKTADEQFTKSFLVQWDSYVSGLQDQVTTKDQPFSVLGSNLTSENLDRLSEDQLLQLYELKTHMNKLKDNK